MSQYSNSQPKCASIGPYHLKGFPDLGKYAMITFTAVVSSPLPARRNPRGPSSVRPIHDPRRRRQRQTYHPSLIEFQAWGLRIGLVDDGSHNKGAVHFGAVIEPDVDKANQQ